MAVFSGLKAHGGLRAGLFLAQIFAILASASAQVIPINFNPGDTTSFDGWLLKASEVPGFHGSFPGFGTWDPIDANVPGSGDADLVKVANGANGGAFIATGSLYFGSVDPDLEPDTFDGTVKFTDATPLAGVNTIVFQVQIGEALGFDFYQDLAPTLTLNGTTPITLQFSALINRYQNGEFPIPDTDPQEFAPIYVNTWGFQWDLSGFGSTITSIDIQFSAVEHAQVYATQLNQSNGVYTTSLVPEPSTWALLGIGLGVMLVGGFRRKVGRLGQTSLP